MSSAFTKALVVLDYIKTNQICIQKGILQYGPIWIPFNPAHGCRVGVASVYELGNGSRTMLDFQPTNGPLYGNLNLDGIESPVINNYLTSLIPGIYPTFSGPINSTDADYSLQSILDTLSTTPGAYLCKVLGLGFGRSLISFQVAEPRVQATSGLTQNYLRLSNFDNNDSPVIDKYFDQSQFLKLENYSNMFDEYTFPETISGPSEYFQRFDWYETFQIDYMTGTNAFPTFAWSGNRSGTSLLTNFQIQQNAEYNYPATFLQYAKNYTKTGMIYAGQGVQVYSVSNKFRLVPYQQGRGIYDYFSYEVSYEDNLVNIIDYPTSYGPEGIQPGRNNAFLGVALTNNFSDSLNLKNQEFTSRTPQDTRFLLTKTNPNISLKATNAPLTYIPPSDSDENTDNGLPWNSLNSFLSNSKVSILQNGVTTMCISGAYPLYRGSHATEYSGFIITRRTAGDSTSVILPQYLSKYYSQYYLTTQFWDPQFNAPITPTIASIQLYSTDDPNYSIPVPPNPPYYLKGARIVLYEGQRVLAGSYVYASMNMVGNVAVSQFVAPSSKEIKFVGGQNNILMQDLYGKYQGNQGSLMVVVQTEDQDPLIVPSCCQPVGIVLETIEGIGTPQLDENDQYFYTHQTPKSTGQQLLPISFESSLQLQSRQITVKLFPMFGNLALSGYSNFVYQAVTKSFRTGQPYTNNSFYKQTAFSSDPTATATISAPYGFCYQKIRTLYTLHDSPFSFSIANNNMTINGTNLDYPYPYSEAGIRGKQFMNDYYGPESYFSSSIFYI